MKSEIEDGMGFAGLVGESHEDREIERLTKRVKELERQLAEAGSRSFVKSRICYRGFSYGMGSQNGIDDLRSAIERNGHG